MHDVPVVAVVFNRPEPTRRLIEALAVVKPRRLFVAADGPRHAADEPKCAEVRRLFDDLPWTCEVERDFSEVNLGCGRRLPTGLNRVFEQVDRAIVLEDDCIPDLTFFRFCEELLERYADDETVGCISGDSIPGIGEYGDASYRFSWLPLIWGWATWRRAWEKYDHHVRDWSGSASEPWLRRRIGNRLARRGLADHFDQAKRADDRFRIWDYQWTYACLRYGMRSVIPRRPMITNVGFGPDATHTKGRSGPRRDPMTPMAFPLVHPGEASPRARDEGEMFHAIHPYVRRQFPPLLTRLRSRGRSVARRALGAAGMRAPAVRQT